jgi:hypothetical protein
MSFFPIIKNFKATSYFKAFMLNAIVGAIICAMAIELRLRLEDEKTVYYGFWSRVYNEKKLNNWHKLVTTLFITFVVSLIVYHFMYFVFLFGGGQLNLIPSISANTYELFKDRKNI